MDIVEQGLSLEKVFDDGNGEHVQCRWTFKLKMSAYRTPPIFTESKPYGRWVDEIKVWQSVTELEAKKQGPAIALSLPESDGGGVRDKVFSELGVESLNAETGVETLIAFLDKLFKKDELSAAYEVYTDFDRYKRSPAISMDNYVTEFGKLYNKTKKYKMTLPESVLAFKLLDGAGLEHKDRQLVLTGVDYNNETTLFQQMSTSLRKFFGKQSMPVGASGGSCAPNVAIKVEPAFVAESADESVYYAGSRNTRNWRGNGRWRGRGPRYNGGANNYGRNLATNVTTGKPKRPTNPAGPDGSPLKCLICESIFHFARMCPDSYENMGRQVKIKEEEAVLFTGTKTEEMRNLTSESMNAAVLDSACSSTVAGQKWMDCYLDTLSRAELSQVHKQASDTIFKFGGGTKLKSKGSITFPCEMAGVKCKITSDIVDSDIPLLLGKPAMKTAKVTLDLENDRATIFGKSIDLQCTSSGHYCVPLGGVHTETETFDVMFTMKEQSFNEQKKIISKLHKQFAHPSSQRLITLLKDAGAHTDLTNKLVEELTRNCETCQKYKKTPARPVTCMPLAKEFNEVVAMDLKEWKPGTYFLHLIDLATRFSLAAVIHRKTPSTIIDKVMTLWIGSGMGPPKKFLADNGGEFANEEFRSMAENLNIEVLNSAGYSPWQNGVCERNHAVVDDCVKKILADSPSLDLEVALVWAVNAKNSLQMVHGWSPYQLVFGANPNLPSVLIDNPPALQGSTVSEMFAKHLNTLYASRKAFIQSECSERIRRALRHQIRSSGTEFQTGDKVYYQRDGQWKGPGKVLGQDGKVVFVRHGNVYVRVSPCRLLKVGEPVITETIKQVDKDSDNMTQTTTQQRLDDEWDDSDLQAKSDKSGSDPGAVNSERGSQEGSKESTTDKQECVKVKGELPKVHDKIRYYPVGSDKWIEAEVMSRGGKATGKNRGWFNIKHDDEEEVKAINFDSGVDQWELMNKLTGDDSDGKQNIEEANIATKMPDQAHQIHKAKATELENWKTFQVYDEVPDSGQPYISTRWVITTKQKEAETVTKARLVARGFEEEEKFQSDSPTAGKETLKTFLALTSTLGWQCETIDIKAAFLQGGSIERDVYLKPPVESEAEGKLWKLRKCVYGLSDASRSWYFNVCEELVKLGCKKSDIDPALFFWQKGGVLSGLLLMHVDDFIWAGTEEFRDMMRKLHSVFKVGKQGQHAFEYIGLSVGHFEGEIVINQQSYVENVLPATIRAARAAQKQEPLTKDETKQLRSLIGQISWVANQTRPDVAFEALELSVSIKDPKVDDLIRANKVIKYLKCEPCEVKFPQLGNTADLKLGVFCDASYANLHDGVSSAGGYIIFLMGKNDKCCPLAWKSNKIRRVVRSTLAAETLSLVESLDAAFYLGHLLSEILFNNQKQNKIPIVVFIDNKSLYENIHSTKTVSEKRLRIDIAGIKEMVQKKEIDSVKWVDTTSQISDSLTKRGAACNKLLQVLQTGYI